MEITQAYSEGHEAYRNGIARKNNPYDSRKDFYAWLDWRIGWNNASLLDALEKGTL